MAGAAYTDWSFAMQLAEFVKDFKVKTMTKYKQRQLYYTLNEAKYFMILDDRRPKKKIKPLRYILGQ